ncbi:hypothetical protein [Eisenbergiella porci]|uniref:hypothetical protein n=1 Tax=Eisenbergiella porci TaxID=2652274 RepID=UPI003A8D0593
MIINQFIISCKIRCQRIIPYLRIIHCQLIEPKRRNIDTSALPSLRQIPFSVKVHRPP